MVCWEQKTALMLQTAFLRISLFLCIGIASSCSRQEKGPILPFYNTPEFSPQFFSTQHEADTKITHKIADFSFTDQNGWQITDKEIEGKVHVANFIFTSCGSICPVLTKHMKMVQAEFKNDSNIVILSFSVTPWIDNVEVLKEYAKRNEINSPNWHLLTRDKETIYSLARKSYFAEEDLGFTKDASNFLHTEHVILIDRKKRIRGIYNGTLQLENEQLIKDMKLLLQETY
ncbi:MAG: SCO family protein [Flavobacterium sp.]|nr:MAG: SCO family protein [Flavobacterium sp.]